MPCGAVAGQDHRGRVPWHAGGRSACVSGAIASGRTSSLGSSRTLASLRREPGRMDAMDHTPLRFGLVGAGPWATNVHAPGIAGAPGHRTRRRVGPQARGRRSSWPSARCHGGRRRGRADRGRGRRRVRGAARGAGRVLAARAAKAGRHLVLEKPVGAHGGRGRAAGRRGRRGGRGVAGAADVPVRARGRSSGATTARTAGGWAAATRTWYGDALLAGPYSSSPWRHERGGLVGRRPAHVRPAGGRPGADHGRAGGARTATTTCGRCCSRTRAAPAARRRCRWRLPVEPNVVEFVAVRRGRQPVAAPDARPPPTATRACSTNWSP